MPNDIDFDVCVPCVDPIDYIRKASVADLLDEADNVERDFYNGLLRIARRYAAEYAGLNAPF
jgi:hypothetical protein